MNVMKMVEIPLRAHFDPEVVVEDPTTGHKYIPIRYKQERMNEVFGLGNWGVELTGDHEEKAYMTTPQGSCLEGFGVSGYVWATLLVGGQAVKLRTSVQRGFWPVDKSSETGTGDSSKAAISDLTSKCLQEWGVGTYLHTNDIAGETPTKPLGVDKVNVTVEDAVSSANAIKKAKEEAAKPLGEIEYKHQEEKVAIEREEPDEETKKEVIQLEGKPGIDLSGVFEIEQLQDKLDWLEANFGITKEMIKEHLKLARLHANRVDDYCRDMIKTLKSKAEADPAKEEVASEEEFRVEDASASKDDIPEEEEEEDDNEEEVDYDSELSLNDEMPFEEVILSEPRDKNGAIVFYQKMTRSGINQANYSEILKKTDVEVIPGKTERLGEAAKWLSEEGLTKLKEQLAI